MNRFVLGPLLALVVMATSSLTAQAGLIGSFAANGPSTFTLNGSGAFNGTSSVTFNLEGVGTFQATLNISGQLTADTAGTAFGLVGQSVSSLAFTITGAGGENYLSGSTNAGVLVGPNGGGTANFVSSTQGDTAGPINFTSDYLLFPNGNRNINLVLSALGGGLTRTGGNLNAASGAVASGSFDTDVTPTPIPVVPEPATMTLLGLGGMFAAVAARFRRSK